MPLVRPRAPTAAPPGPSQAGTLRRLDWRFLLPGADEAPIGTLRLVAGDPALAGQITAAGLATRVLTGTHDGEAVDAVVALGSSPQPLAEAVATLRPGGLLYWEVERSGLRGLVTTPGRLRRRCAREGLDTVTYWRRRTGRYDTFFLPTTVPGAGPWYLEELADDRAGLRRLAVRGLRVLLRGDGRRLDRVAPRYSLVGVRRAAGARSGAARWRRRSQDGPSRPSVGPPSLSPAILDAPGGETVLPVVLARGEGQWSRLVLLPFGAEDRRPQAVVKVARTAEHNWATESEQRSLADLGRLLPAGLAATVPAPRGVRAWRGLAVGEETFLPGRPVARLARSSRRAAGPDTALSGVVGWLIDLHLGTRVDEVNTDVRSTSDMLEAPAREAARLLHRPLRPHDGHPRPWLVPPGGVKVPIVWQHCDLTPQNVRWDGRGFSVVDWEAARTGPALCDLFYLLLHWPWPHLPSFGHAPHDVFAQVFLGTAEVPARAAAQQVARYCEALGVDAGLVGPLLVHMLAQQALDRAERIRDSGEDPAADHNLYADLLERTMRATERVPAWTILG